MNGVQTRFKCKLDVKRCKRFVFPPSSLLPRSNALKTKAIRYFQTDRTLTRIVSPPLHRPIVREVNAVFDFIEKPYTPVDFKELLVSPNDMRKRFIALINKEIKNKEQGKEAYILAKVNHITDRALVEKLYEASTAGVQVELVVRGNCSLVTGVPGISENIHINGIIDRYLEHSRIFIFANGGEEKYYIGSADWMPRNLDNRIEVAAPVYDKEIQADLKRIVCYGFRDTAKGRIVDGTGENREKEREENSVPFRSQEKLYNEYKNTL